MATKINTEYLEKNFDYNLKEEIRGDSSSSSATILAAINRVYDEMFVLIKDCDITVQTLADMESRLDTEEKQDWFRKAQCYQLIYEHTSGKNALIIPDTFDINAKSWDWCSDTVRIIRKILGFNRPTLFTQR